MEECILCKITEGSIPSHKVYEDENTLAIMDIHPIQDGHVLAFTKKHVEAFEQLEEDDFANLMRTVHKVSNRIKSVLTPPKVGIVIEGFDVPHVHVKVIPISNEVELRHIPNMKAEPDHEVLAQMASKLAI